MYLSLYERICRELGAHTRMVQRKEKKGRHSIKIPLLEVTFEGNTIYVPHKEKNMTQAEIEFEAQRTISRLRKRKRHWC